MGIFYILMTVGVAAYANSKGRSVVGWAIIALFITPPLAIIILAFLKNLKDEEKLQQYVHQQEQLNDRIGVNEINTNRRLDNIEKKIESIEDRQKQMLGAGAPLAIDQTQAPAPQEETKIVEPEVVVPEAEAVEAVPAAQVQETAATKFCPYCGSEVNAVNKFCGNCGAKL